MTDSCRWCLRGLLLFQYAQLPEVRSCHWWKRKAGRTRSRSFDSPRAVAEVGKLGSVKGTTRPGRGAVGHGVTVAEGGKALGEDRLPQGSNDFAGVASTPGSSRSVLSPVGIITITPALDTGEPPRRFHASTSRMCRQGRTPRQSQRICYRAGSIPLIS